MSMFLHHKFIAVEHHVALEHCTRNHPIIPMVLAKLYKLAADGLVEPVPSDAEFTVTRLLTPLSIAATATEAKTGIFLQLIKTMDKPSPRLTMGQKWAAEVVNEQQGNVATLLW